MDILLETERLILRRLINADLDHIFELDNDPEVMRYLNGGKPTPREVIQHQVLPEFIAYGLRVHGYGFWAAIDRQTQVFLGWFSCRPEAVKLGEVSIGYRLQRITWGQGYATEGAQALIEYAFTKQDVQCVIATTYEENCASIRVMEKAGMTFRRAFHVTEEDLENATFHTDEADIWDGDDVEYAITKTDWLHRQSNVPNQ